VDFEGRIIYKADPGPGEMIVVAPIDISALRHERATRRGHQTLAHLRTETFPLYRGTCYPPGRGVDGLSIEGIDSTIAEAKARFLY
jgi:formamidase